MITVITKDLRMRDVNPAHVVWVDRCGFMTRIKLCGERRPLKCHDQERRVYDQLVNAVNELNETNAIHVSMDAAEDEDEEDEA